MSYLYTRNLFLHDRATDCLSWGDSMSEPQYNAVSRRLNDEVTGCEEGDLAFRIHNWGIDWRHYSNRVHRHSFYEVCYVLEGEGEYEDEGVTYRLRDGSQFVSVPGHWHQIRSRGGMKLFFVAYELSSSRNERLAAEYEEALQQKAVPVIANNENVSALLWRALFLEADAGASASRTSVLAGMLLASFATVFVPCEPAAPREAQPPRSQTLLVTMARRFIRDNLSRQLKLGDVARYLNVSERHLSRLFRLHGGESFGDCLTRERLRLAETMLRTTVQPTKEIAEAAGFQSIHYFTRMFSAHYGVPPAAFRKRCMDQVSSPASKSHDTSGTDTAITASDK